MTMFGVYLRSTGVKMFLILTLALLPLVLKGDVPGNEIERPMAVVILGGLITSAALNLLVLPNLALRFGHFVPRKEP